jgi:hypothetical protein
VVVVGRGFCNGELWILVKNGGLRIKFNEVDGLVCKEMRVVGRVVFTEKY